MATSDVNDNFFKKDTPHGLVKRFMWKKYVQAFIAKTQQSKYFDTTIIFDGFAGAGRYGSENEWPDDIAKYGSPLISLRAAIDFHSLLFRKNNLLEQERYVFIPERIFSNFSIERNDDSDLHGFNDDSEKIQLYFVEKNKKNYKKLVDNVIVLFMKYNIKVKISEMNKEIYVTSCDRNIPVGCKIINASFEDVDVPYVAWSHIMASFIDPYGYTQIPMEKIKEFTGRKKDVFINLMSQHVNRFKNVGTKDGLEKLFHLDYEVIHERLSSYQGEAIENIAKLYIDVLEEQANVQFHLSFEMRNKGNVPLFHMIFASDHESGFDSMKEAMNRGTQSQDKFSLSDYLIVKKNQHISFGNDQDDEHVADTIYEEFKGQAGVHIDGIKDFIMYQTIFVWRKKPLKILEIERQLMICVSTDKVKRKKGTYPDKFFFIFNFLD